MLVIDLHSGFQFDMLIIVIGAKLHSLIWIACSAPNQHVEKHAMEAIQKDSVGAYKLLLGDLIEHWPRYTSTVNLKHPNNTTNFVDSFNRKMNCLATNQFSHFYSRLGGSLWHNSS